MCNFSMITNCDFNFSVSITTHKDLSFDYMQYHELQPTSTGINLTLVRKLLQRDD